MREERPQEIVSGVGSSGFSTLTGSVVPGSGADALLIQVFHPDVFQS